ncbi:flagellar hook-associated protein FlgK [Cellulomonas cellasea]|uniref:Flagellar hook-associated protein 1 n=2 Tax=Cellulomonas cellasea TaxID=43670 RepID=A0A0A0B5N2_9CELL|nr:flagellar hook-associated protein FlgK [Cellulomonas cellasea]KGM01134.1 flagellar hook protein FlgK [Cellulomonas cellasea DSM 20118]GEA90133.1 flagellar hook-associated protein FlgK [Cellulomonas cellasea]
MSTFSGLGTALSSLIAQRQALDVSGQNVANANTVGYTRQRAAMSALPAASVASMFSTSDGVGLGVNVTGVSRLGDAFLDARVRTETAGASYLAAQSAAYTQLEKSVGEPSTTGLAKQLSNLWGAFGDVSNTPDKDSARAVLLETAQAVVDRVASLYDAAESQWSHARTTTAGLVDQVNTTAANVADLNARILAITNSGAAANELLDQRDQLVVQLSGLVGATTRTRPDGQLDVYVAGNTLVDGAKAKTLEVTGATTFAQATGGAAVTVGWAGKPGLSVGLDGGRVAGLLSVTAPPGTPAGSGGMLTEAAASYDALATRITTQVNALHSTATRADGTTPGGAFFTIDAGKPAALGLRVAITDPSHVAVGNPAKGPLDGSVGDALAKLGTAKDGPDASWSATVVSLGVRTASAASRANVAETSRASAAAQQLSQASVDTDEEAVNMLAYQRAYEGAARVLTAIDEMLDTLINRTGVVGR